MLMGRSYTGTYRKTTSSSLIQRRLTVSKCIPIDMDLAKETGSERSGARRRTGTMEFMAINMLLKFDVL
jgi:hypothetical protein